jgi:hypothetical protein
MRFAAAVFACFLCLSASPALAAFKIVPGNPADKLAAVPIDPQQYDYAKKCLKKPQKGMLALQSWLQAHVQGVSWGIMRCEKLSAHNYSLHSEGRALD